VIRSLTASPSSTQDTHAVRISVLYLVVLVKETKLIPVSFALGCPAEHRLRCPGTFVTTAKMKEAPVREINFIQGAVANTIIFTMVAGVDDGAEHQATWRFEQKGIKGHGKGGNRMKHTRPCHPLPNPPLQLASGEGGATGGDQTEPNTEVASGGLPELK